MELDLRRKAEAAAAHRTFAAQLERRGLQPAAAAMLVEQLRDRAMQLFGIRLAAGLGDDLALGRDHDEGRPRADGVARRDDAPDRARSDA